MAWSWVIAQVAHDLPYVRERIALTSIVDGVPMLLHLHSCICSIAVERSIHGIQLNRLGVHYGSFHEVMFFVQSESVNVTEPWVKVPTYW